MNEIILFLLLSVKIGDRLAVIPSCETFIPSILDTTPNGEIELSFCCIGVKRLNLGPSGVVSTVCFANEKEFVNAFEAESSGVIEMFLMLI